MGRSSARRSLRASPILAILAVVACSGDVISTVVEVELRFPEGADPLEGVTTLRVRVVPEDGSDELVNLVERPSSGSWEGLDAGLELGLIELEQAQVIVEGLDGGGVVRAAGESIPIPIKNRTPGQVAVFFQTLGTSGLAPPLERGLSHHGAAYVEGGGVILAGGDEATKATAVYAVDFYEPIELAELESPRSLVTLTTLGGSRALLLGGSQPAELGLTYSPLTNEWSELELPEAFTGSWARPVVAPLPDGGAVALRGRAILRVAPGPPATSAQLGELPIELAGATLSVLDSDLALVIGDGEERWAVAFDPTSGQEIALEQPPAGGRTGHGAATLADGRLVLAGGAAGEVPIADVEIYDPAQEAWVVLEGLLEGHERSEAPLITLRDDRLLLVGGVGPGGQGRDDALVIDLLESSVAVVSLASARRGHSVTALPTGAALIAGGEDESGTPLTTVEVLRPPLR